MKKWLLALTLLLASTAFGQRALTRVQDTINNPDGTAFSGTLHITWPTAYTFNGSTIQPGTMDIEVVSGALDVRLAPSGIPGTMGLVYVVSAPMQGRVYLDYWVVPLSSSTVTVANLRPSLFADQLWPSGANNGDVMTYSSSTHRWAPAAGGGGGSVDLTSVQSLTNKTVDGVTPTIFGYLDATSSIQTQLNAKAASNASTTVNGQSCALGGSCSITVGSSANEKIRTIGAKFQSSDGTAMSGTVVSCQQIDFAGTLTDWSVLADVSGSVTLGIKTVALASYTGESGYSGYTDIINAGTAPSLSSAAKASSSTLTSWTTSLTAGQVLCVQLSSPATATKATLKLHATAS